MNGVGFVRECSLHVVNLPAEIGGAMLRVLGGE
jgi:hypothetical protein